MLRWWPDVGWCCSQSRGSRESSLLNQDTLIRLIISSAFPAVTFHSSPACSVWDICFNVLPVSLQVSFFSRTFENKMFPWGKQSFRISILVLHLIIFPNSSVLSLFPSKKRCVVRLQEPEGFSWVYGGHCNVFCWTSQWESATLACQDPVSRLKCPLMTRGAL